MEPYYQWVGRIVVWSVELGLLFCVLRELWQWIYNKLPRHPWLFWPLFWLQYAFGRFAKPRNSFGPPFYFNRADNRAYTKKHMGMERAAQAIIARYNRRRWQKMEAGTHP